LSFQPQMQRATQPKVGVSRRKARVRRSKVPDNRSKVGASRPKVGVNPTRNRVSEGVSGVNRPFGRVR
jgi:hypothetical protein